MPAPKVSENDFILAWESARERGIGSYTLAKELGMDRRDLMRRRRRLEGKYGQLKPLAGSSLRVPEETRLIHYDHEYSGVIFSDCHWHPNVETPATEILLQVMEDLSPDIVIANGDVMDGWTISRHPRIGWDHGPTVKEEIEICQYWMELIREHSPEAEHIWTIGNHDMRFDTYLASNCAQYEGVEGTSLHDHFKDWDYVWACSLSDQVMVKHRFKGGQMAARANALNAGVSMVTGHTHKLRVVPVSDYTGTRYGVETGTLMDPTSPQMLYAESNPLDMQQGFIVFHMTTNGPIFEPVEVKNGVSIWRGKTYKY